MSGGKEGRRRPFFYFQFMNKKFSSTKFVKSAVCILFVISGFTGLAYEVVWVRMFTAVFGNTVFATSTVLTAFMGGLALGSYLIGRLTDKKAKQINALKIYAGLEIGIGIAALLIFVALMLLDTIYTWFFRNISTDFKLLVALRFILSSSALIVPTMLMGGTLPALSKYVIKAKKEIGKNLSILYALNTFGAVLGCFLTGFVLIATLGLHLTIYLAAFVNITIGLIAFGLSKTAPFKTFAPESDAGQAESTEQLIPSNIRVILVVFGLSG
ncbi:MAG: fused MFS/spermidine synthase, partial [Deltaproteobacteria bacterium]|nr:fused MFS/spermidine synthase [Deltaproteobacteria bacterium]